MQLLRMSGEVTPVYVTLSASLEPAPQCLVLDHTPLWVVGLVRVQVSS